MQTSAPSGGAPAPLMSHRQILFVIFGLMAGMFLSALDQTVVGTSMRTIADDLDGLALQAWVTTAYLIMSTISTPIYGKLSDLFGRRLLFIIAIVIFLVGSLLSGMATSMYGLALSRAVQGLGAGGLMALPLTIMGDILAPRERAKYQGYFLAVFGVSSVIGPLLGGLLSGSADILGIAGWRWVFLINIPVGIVALGIVLRFLHIPRLTRAVRIDWWGAATVIIAAVPLLLVAEQGRTWGWDSALAIGCYVVGALGIAAFIFTEKVMGDDALIPLKLFRSSTFSMATILGVLVGFGMFGAMMIVPLYLQLVDGATPTESGLLMMPMILGLIIASIASGQLIARTGRYKVYPTLGTAFMALGFGWFTFAEASRPVWFMMIGMLFVGLGLGQLMQTLTIASQNSVNARDIGVATSASTFFRQIGGTLGTAVLYSVLFTRIPVTITNVFGAPSTQESLKSALSDPTIADDPKNAQIIKLLGDPSGLSSALDGDTSFLNTSSPQLSDPFLVAFNDAAVSAFWVSLVVVLIAFILRWFLKTPPLRTTSALQEVADAGGLVDDEGARIDGAGTARPRAPAPTGPTHVEQQVSELSGHARSAADQMGALVEPGTHTTDRDVLDDPDARQSSATH